MKKAIITEKIFEFCLGVILLIPPVLSVFLFIFSLLSKTGYSDEGMIVDMKNLNGQWDWHVGDNGDYGGSGASMSPTPIYLGLMAIAGVLLVKNSMRYFFYKRNDTNKIKLPKL